MPASPQCFWTMEGRQRHRQVLKAGALGWHRGIGWEGSWEGGSGWGTHVNPCLIHVNVWQKPLQYCKVISLQLIKINEKTMENPGANHFWSMRERVTAEEHRAMTDEMRGTQRAGALMHMWNPWEMCFISWWSRTVSFSHFDPWDKNGMLMVRLGHLGSNTAPGQSQEKDLMMSYAK